MKIQKVARKSMAKNKQVNEDITNKILEKRNAASRLQAAAKREDIQHIYNIGVENPRSANKITAAIKRKNLKSMKESITNLKDVYVIPKFKHELDLTNINLDKKYSYNYECERIINNTENAFVKILESYQTLLSIVKRDEINLQKHYKKDYDNN